MRLSHAPRSIRQNLFFAFVYNALGVSVAAGVLYPFFGLLLSPMIVAAVMNFSPAQSEQWHSIANSCRTACKTAFAAAVFGMAFLAFGRRPIC